MLPSTLLELVYLRFSTRANSTFLCNIRAGGQIRRVQHFHDTRSVYGGYTVEPSITKNFELLKTRRLQSQIQAVSELEERVAALKDTAEEFLQAAEAKREGPYFSDNSLQDIFKDLLAPPSPQEPPIPELQVTSVPEIEQVLRERLPELEAAAQAQAHNSGGLSSRLQNRIVNSAQHPAWSSTKINMQAKISEDIARWDTTTPLRELVSRLRVVQEILWSCWPPLEANQSSPEVKPTRFHLLLDAEWRAFGEACLYAEDPFAAEAVLELMKRVGSPPSDEQYDMVLNYFAERGDTEDADAHIAHFGPDIPRERQRDLLIKSRVKSKRLEEASSLLHMYETRNLPAPIRSYTRVIKMLLDQRGPGSAQQIAQAWDLFAHMRYVAHPVPDAFLYSTMIRAAPEPQRALDLFTEMTVEQGIIPDTFAYTAVIRACARHKSFALDAFRIAREMLNSYRDAHGEVPPHLRPDMHTFLGLLDAAKRLGDLSRALWTIAEMFQGVPEKDGSPSLVYVDERALTHLFYTYATYRPPFRRGSVPMLREEAKVLSNEEQDLEEEVTSQARNLEALGPPRFRALPQSRQEIVREVTMLWTRVQEDRRPAMVPHLTPFCRVKPDAKLLNAYLAVHFAHSPPSEAYNVYDVLFEQAGVQRDARSYVLALEAYAQGNRHIPREELLIALSAVRNIWKDWSDLEDNCVDRLYDRDDSDIQTRLVERAWTAMIRLLTLTENLEEAEDLLRRFVRRYPPDLVKQAAPADPRRSNRTQLFAERPIVRLIEPSTIPEDRISPFLLFNDTALLHNRALARKNMALVNYMKWVFSAYEGALRRRREAQYRSR